MTWFEWLLTLIFAIVVAYALEWIHGCIIDRKFDRIFENAMSNLESSGATTLEDEQYGTITTDENSMYVQTNDAKSSDEQHVIAFDAIQAIHAYKKDLLTEDLICLVIRYEQTGLSNQKVSDDEAEFGDILEIHEHMKGYNDLLQTFEAKLPNYSNAWFLDIFSPAFEVSFTEAWTR